MRSRITARKSRLEPGAIAKPVVSIREPVSSLATVLLYGHEGWTLTKVLEKKLAAFEMWIYFRTLRIPWTSRISKVEVLNRMSEEMEVLNEIKRRRLEYFGHIIRNEKYRLLQLGWRGRLRA
jgi:hypothetical protein